MDISIIFDNAHGVFVPGYEVTGSIIFTVVDSPLKARAVVISVDGRASTHWTVSERHSSVTPHSHGHNHGQTQTTHRTITYSACVPYASGEAVVWSPPPGEASGHLTLGTHKFPFRFQLPPNCPPSFEGTNGYIRYFCKAKIDRPWKFDHTIRRVFTVVPTFDLNLLPHAALPVSMHNSRDLGVFIFKHGRISVTAKMCKGGYVPGESIIMQAEIINSSSRAISKIELKLVEQSRYVAHRNGHVYAATAMCGSIDRHGEIRTAKRTVNSFEEKVEIEKGSTLQYSRMVPIPPVVPTFNTCPIIQVEYYLKLKISAKGTVGNTLSSSLPVLVGTVPIRQFVPIPHSSQRASFSAGPPPQPSAPSEMDPPPSYEECVFGKGTMKDEEENKDFAPRYVYYPNIQPSAPPPE